MDHTHEPQITFVQLVRLCQARLYWFIGASVLAIAAAVVLTMTQTPVYESERYLEVGLSSVNIPVEDPGQIIEKLQAQYLPLRDNVLPAVEKVEFANKGNSTRILKIVGRAHSPAEADTFTTGIIQKIVQRHVSEQTSLNAMYTAQIGILESQLHAVTATSERLLSAGKLSDQAATNLIEMTRDIPGLSARIVAMHDNLRVLTANMTQEIDYQTDNVANKVVPKPLLYVVIALLLANISLVFVILARELFATASPRHK